ncbi:MAG: hypothetical protein ABR951_10010 [Candidatus Aminicenantales bacterium]|jgi:hypothetical protein
MKIVENLFDVPVKPIDEDYSRIVFMALYGRNPYGSAAHPYPTDVVLKALADYKAKIARGENLIPYDGVNDAAQITNVATDEHGNLVLEADVMSTDAGDALQLALAVDGRIGCVTILEDGRVKSIALASGELVEGERTNADVNLNKGLTDEIIAEKFRMARMSGYKRSLEEYSKWIKSQ